MKKQIIDRVDIGCQCPRCVQARKYNKPQWLAAHMAVVVQGEWDTAEVSKKLRQRGWVYVTEYENKMETSNSESRGRDYLSWQIKNQLWKPINCHEWVQLPEGVEQWQVDSYARSKNVCAHSEFATTADVVAYRL